jgi:hypothetical protein
MQLPFKLWAFTTGEFCLYERGHRVVEKDYCFAKRVYLYNKDKMSYQTEFVFQKPLLDLVEFVGRRVLGACATALSFLIFYPIGLTAKLLHVTACSIYADPACQAIYQKAEHIWKDSHLAGHTLTSAPDKWRQFACAPLSWHLRADGTDRRSMIITFDSNGIGVKQKSECDLFPFELFECIYRRVLGGAVWLGAAALSPIGFAAKCVHYAAQAALQNENACR